MPKCILVVDDNARSLTSLAEALEEAGYAPVAVQSSDDPIVQFGIIKPELVFLSLLDHNAIATCEGIRDNPEGAIVPIIFVGTGAESVRSPSDALTQGGDYYFPSPLDQNKVLAKVQTYVGMGSRAAEAQVPPPSEAPVPQPAPAPLPRVPRPPTFPQNEATPIILQPLVDEPTQAVADAEMSRRAKESVAAPATPELPGLPTFAWEPPPASPSEEALGQAADDLLGSIRSQEAAKAQAAEQARLEAERKTAEAETLAKQQREAEAEAKRVLAEAEQRRIDAENRRRIEAAARAAAEAEAQRLLAEQTRRQAEEEAERQRQEAKARAAAEAEAKRQAEEEAARRRQEAESRAAAAAEAKRQADEAARRQAEDELRRRIEAETRQRVEEELRQRAEAEARRQAEEEIRRRADEEAKRQADEELRRRAEAEAKRKADEELRRRAEEESKQRAEAEAKRKAEEDHRRRAEEDAKRKADADAELKRQIEAEVRRKVEAELSAERPAAPRATLPVAPAPSQPQQTVEPLTPQKPRALGLAPLTPLNPAEGTFAGHQDIAWLMFEIVRQQVTGRVDFSSDNRKKTLFVERGAPVDAYSSQVFDRMEEYLYRDGKITRAQYQEVRVKALKTPRKIGAFLVSEGFMKPEELFAAVRGYLMEIVAGLFEWEAGEFKYTSERVDESDRISLDVDPKALIVDGVRRKYLLPRLMKRLGAPSSLLGPQSNTPLDAESLGLTADERQLARLVDGTRSIEDLVFSSGLTAPRVYQLLTVLVAGGYLEVRVRGIEGLNEDGASQGDEIDRRRIREKLLQVRELDYFQVLGVPRAASAYEIARAFERQSHEFAGERFSAAVQRDLFEALQEIGRVLEDAREVLAIDTLRAAYARHLS